MTPYIKQELRDALQPPLETLITLLRKFRVPYGDGAVCYVFTRILKTLYKDSYAEYVKAVGVLETCKLELYRAVIAPYEDKKKWEYGDVEGK